MISTQVEMHTDHVHCSEVDKLDYFNYFIDFTFMIEIQKSIEGNKGFNFKNKFHLMKRYIV